MKKYKYIGTLSYYIGLVFTFIEFGIKPNEVRVESNIPIYNTTQFIFPINLLQEI